MITKLFLYLFQKPNPCLNCIVQPTCNIPKTLVGKCKDFNKYDDRNDKIKDWAEGIITGFWATVIILIFCYFIFTFALGIVYQLKLIFG